MRGAISDAARPRCQCRHHHVPLYPGAAKTECNCNRGFLHISRLRRPGYFAPDYPACRGSTALHPRPTRRAFRDLRTQQPTSEIYITLHPDRDCKPQRNLQTAQPSPREHRNTPSTAIRPPNTQHSNNNPPRRRTKPHPQQQIAPHQATQQNPTATEGAQECTLDQIFFPPLRPLLRHPTAVEGTTLCTLNSNCTTQPACTATQPPPKAQGNAPSTAISTPSHPAESNRHRRRTGMHPRPRLAPQAPSPATAIHPEGAQECTLDRFCPHSDRCSTIQLPPKVHRNTPSTGFTPTPAAIPSPNCRRRCSMMHPQQQLHGATHPHGSTTTNEGARKCALNRD